MHATILDKKQESNSICYLCKVSLSEYIKAIPPTYRDFDVQRGIVANRYLDQIATTIAGRRHIPPIVLVSDELSRVDDNHVIVNDFRILDGLQRTHRLRVIWNLLEFICSGSDRGLLLDSTAKFTRRYANEIRDIGGDSKLIRQLERFVRSGDIHEPGAFFEGNYLWIEIWTGLSQSEQIEKMLLLNAGHKSVNIKHQLELLFLSTLFRLEDIAPDGVSFVREKDISSIQHSKTRTAGQYHFSHIVSSLVALSAGRIVQTNADFVSDLQSNQTELVELVEGFNLELVAAFMKFLFALDTKTNDRYRDTGRKWLGREVVLIGIFGAIGDYSDETGTSRVDTLTTMETKIDAWVPKLMLERFEEERNNVELNKVNVGNVNKRAVYNAFHDLFRDPKPIVWSSYFGGQK